MATAGARGGELKWTRNLGRNGYDAPADLLPDQSYESWNLVLQRNAIATKRNGSTLQPLTGDFLRTPYAAMARFIPGQDDSLAELHIIENGGLVGRIAPGGVVPLLQAPAFPLPVLDNFNRADGPQLGGEWRASGTNPPLRLVSNQAAQAPAGYSLSYYSKYFDLDFQAYITVSVLPEPTLTVFPFIDLCLFTRAPLAIPNDFDGFYLRLQRAGTGACTLSVLLITDGQGPALMSTPIGFAAGDAFGISRVGPTLNMHARLAGVWAVVGSVTDPSYRVPLLPAIMINDPEGGSVCRLDDFGGGPLLTGSVTGIPMVDVIETRPQDATWAQQNGKLYWAYNSSVDRLHVYDPATSNQGVRRTGLAAPTVAATVTNTGTGTYAPTLRYYRIQWIAKAGTDLRRASALGPAVSFTPSGTGAAARIAAPAQTPSEPASHWRVWGSANGSLYYALALLDSAVASFFDDTVNPADYANGREAAPEEGAFTNWPSVKYLLATGDRLVGFGAYEPDPASAISKVGRVYFSPVIDSTDFDDDERISNSLTNKGWIDVGRNIGAEDRALGGPLDGNLFVFQSRGMWMLVPTGDNITPYRRVMLSPLLGAVSHHSTFVGEDENGTPCLYFLDPGRGPYRYGPNGLQWCAYDVQDLWARVNLVAPNKVAHGLYDPELRACIWWVSLDGVAEPTYAIVFFVREGRQTENDGIRNGWVIWGGQYTRALSSVLFAQNFGMSVSRTMKPYAGTPEGLVRGNDPLAVADIDTPYSAYAISRAFDIAPSHHKKALEKTYLNAKTARNVVIDQVLLPDYEQQPKRTATVSISPKGTESRVLVRVQETALAEFASFQVILGQTAALPNVWQIDGWLATAVPTDSEV